MSLPDSPKFWKPIFLSVLFFVPFFVGASVTINEVMYDLEGSDSGREWVEIFNDGSEEVNLENWKFYENETNHKISLISETGDFIISADGYAIIVDNIDKFLIDWPNFSGIIFDSAFSLKNAGENLALKDSELNLVDEINYLPEWGANGDTNSLQKINGEWLGAVPTLGVQNKEEEQEQPQEEEQEPQATNVVVWPVEPQIYANAGEDKVSVAGAGVVFFGKALGLQKEPLENARFLWSFGDGSMGEGQNAIHYYKYPAEYIVVLDVSPNVVGELSVSDRLKVRIEPNELEIVEANENYIKLHNGSPFELDISGWFLKKNIQGKADIIFVFPKSTFISANSDLPISSEISGIKTKQGESIEILYSNGLTAYTYEPLKKEKPNLITAVESVQKVVQLKIQPTTLISESIDEEEIDINTQPANIITVAQNNSWSVKKWAVTISVIGLFAGISAILFRGEENEKDF